MGQTIVQVDAFTDEPYTGNPAAVCVLDEVAEDAWMQRVASEMNLSETAFLHPTQTGWRLRWFTPATEVDLCGHATLAAAHVLWDDGYAEPSEAVVFETNSGPLTCVREEDEGWIAMDFPSVPPWETDVPKTLPEALGEDPAWLGTNRLDLIVVYNDPAQVRELEPNMELLKEIPYRGVAVTSVPDAPAQASGADFVSRFFAPRLGVPEDPVTGSVHCALGPYWCNRLGRDVVTGLQVSGRPGKVRVRKREKARVDLIGQAVTVLRGELVEGEPR